MLNNGQMVNVRNSYRVGVFFEAMQTFVSPPSTSCFYKSLAGVKWCMCIEWDGANTMENVAPLHLPLVPSLHSWGPAPLSSLTEMDALQNGGEKEVWREK